MVTNPLKQRFKPKSNAISCNIIDMTTRSFDIHKLFHFNLLHMKSHFMALRPTLKDLANNCCQLVAASSPNHQIFCIDACMLQLMLQEDLENSGSMYKNTDLTCM